jgi:hypothetical protein
MDNTFTNKTTTHIFLSDVRGHARWCFVGTENTLDSINTEFCGTKYDTSVSVRMCNKSKVISVQALRIQEVVAPRISRQLGHGGGKVVSCTHRPSLPPGKTPWYSFLLEAESTAGPK